MIAITQNNVPVDDRASARAQPLARLARCDRIVPEVGMKVNMLEAKSQLSKLVKAAMEGEQVVIARNGEPAVRLVPVAKNAGLAGWGKLRRFAAAVDPAFKPEVEAEVKRSLEGRR
jgi:prevent-host-death family protein